MSELDEAYANGAYIADADSFVARWPIAAAAFRDACSCELGLPYGAGARAAFDLFLPQDTPRGCMIFVHGGYWKAFDRSFWSHLAAGAVARDWAVAMPSYDLCPDVRISEITQHIRAAVHAIAARVDGPISLCGHSAGGHLVARMMAPGMLSRDVLARVTACVPISPLSDLEPLLRTSMNLDFKLDVAEARAESPIHQAAPDAPVTVWVGGDERPAFLDQAAWLAEAWGCEHVVVPGRHHFDVIDDLEQPDSDLVARLTAG